MEEKTVPAVKALVERDGRFLAIKTDAADVAPRWGLPGGKVEYGESPEEALRREVQEEVSLDVEVGEVVGVYDFFYKKHHIVPVVFLCQPGDTDVELQSGIDGHQSVEEFEWLWPREFVDRETVEGLRRVVAGFYGL